MSNVRAMGTHDQQFEARETELRRLYELIFRGKLNSNLR